MPTHPNVDLSKLSARLRTKRAKKGLREVAKEIGDISASTLSRIEQGNVPDIDTFMSICRWLGADSNEFMTEASDTRGSSTFAENSVSTPQFIEAHLRADRILPPETISALSEMIRLAYNAANEGKLDKQKK